MKTFALPRIRDVRWQLLLYLGILAVSGAVALSGRPFWQQVGLGISTVALVAVSWDILARCGLSSLGQAAFMGLGAYASAILAPKVGPVAAWMIAVILCAAMATMLGFVTLRLRGMYFSIATLGLTLALQVVALMFPSVTGGGRGIAPPLVGGGLPDRQLIWIAVWLVVAAITSDIFLNRRFRPALLMIRSNDALAAASGIPVVATKTMVFAVSGAIAGISGIFFGGLYGWVTPTDIFNPALSIAGLASAILGGSDSTFGPILGAIGMRGLEELSKHYISGVGYQVVYGAVIILVITLAPGGLFGLAARLRAFLSGRARTKKGGKQHGGGNLGSEGISDVRRVTGAERGND